MRGIRISPKFNKSDWDNLNLNGYNSDWKTAIDIFEDRMQGRFFEQIKILEENPNRNIGVFAGFAIMSLDCLLIETIEQFIKGKIRTGQGMNAKSFFDFFQRSDNFKMFFNNQSKATVFYQQIRCGLLHQAQTKGKSIIHIRSGPMLEWIDNKNPRKGLKIQREKFHGEVVKIYESYCRQLRDDRNMNLKGKFRRKMENIIAQK